MPKFPPTVFDRLRALAMNLWWSWTPDAQQLFISLDPPLWPATRQSPLRMLQSISSERKSAVEQDERFLAHLARVETSFADYMKAKTWFSKQKGVPKNALVAYFCAEFAVHESLPQYSGGLGVLAGDHVKSASDLGLPFFGIGLLYRRGFYSQEFNADGSTRVVYPTLDFAQLPITDTGKTIVVPIAGRKVTAKLWRQDVGRVSMILMDTDTAPNKPADRTLTAHLYGGDHETRIQQEILLGIGGVMALEAMGLKATAFHMNEGHAAFAALDRVARRIAKGDSREAAMAAVRASSVFTTHTPVPAGNDRFDAKMTLKYVGHYAAALGVTKDELLALGREVPADKNEQFCMTVLALKLSDHRNGVAELHGDTSRRMWVKTFNATSHEEVPIGFVTNGVHTASWLAPEMRVVYDKYLRPDWTAGDPTGAMFGRVDNIPDDVLWKTRGVLRARLLHFVRQRLLDQIARRHGDVKQLAAAFETFDDQALTIGFARRFATYKRGTLIFRDLKRLASILGNKDRPVQLIFAGKAHPKDMGGQKFAQDIFNFAEREGLKGRVVLLEDYDMLLGRMLTSGADVWLNNPLRPQEASGTSGMKGPLHGGLNCSILDGWWPEAFNGKNGWAIGDGSQLDDLVKQDKNDAESIYRLIETEIAPAFYSRDGKGVPTKWVAMMRESIKTVGSVFNTHRMVGEYWTKFYAPASASK